LEKEISLIKQPVTKTKPNGHKKDNGQNVVRDFRKALFANSQLIYYPANKGYGNKHCLNKTKVHGSKNSI
jgi:hypothetical protein